MPIFEGNMPKVLDTIIIGCGQIAGQWSMGPSSDAILTHADAYSRHGGFRIVACVEPAADRRAEFMRYWSIPRGYDRLSDCLMQEHPIVASVCSTTNTHAEILSDLLNSSVRAVFCEKPITAEVGTARDLVDAYRNAGKLLIVNYTRRWDPAIGALRAELASGEWGAVRAVAAWYVRGVVNNGSHAVDLLHWLIGPVRIGAVAGSRQDGVDGDPTVDAILKLENGASVHLIAGDGRDMGFFEIQILTESGMIAIEESGMKIRRRRATEDSLFAGRRQIHGGEWQEGGYKKAMLHAVDEIHAAVVSGTPVSSTGESALAALSICDALRRAT